jgi:hypothetical protein
LYDNLITLCDVMYYFYFSIYLYITYYCIDCCMGEQWKYVLLVFLAFNAHMFVIQLKQMIYDLGLMSLAIFNCHQFYMGWLHILIKYYVILSFFYLPPKLYVPWKWGKNSNIYVWYDILKLPLIGIDFLLLQDTYQFLFWPWWIELYPSKLFIYSKI